MLYRLTYNPILSMLWSRRLDRRMAQVLLLTVGIMLVGLIEHLPRQWPAGLVNRYRASVCLVVAGLMAIALKMATQTEIAAFESGHFLSAWPMWVFLVSAAAICGLGFGMVEVTRYKDLLLTLPWSPLDAFTRKVLSRIVRAIAAWTASASIMALCAVVQIAQNFDRHDPSPLFTPDPWPSGSSPIIIYDLS